MCGQYKVIPDEFSNLGLRFNLEEQAKEWRAVRTCRLVGWLEETGWTNAANLHNRHDRAQRNARASSQPHASYAQRSGRA